MKNLFRQRNMLILASVLAVIVSATAVHIFFSHYRSRLFQKYIYELSEPLSQTIVALIKNEMMHDHSCRVEESFQVFSKQKTIQDIYVTDAGLKVLSSSDSSAIERSLRKLFPEPIPWHILDDGLYSPIGKNRILVASVLENSPNCNSCHDKSIDNLGYIFYLFDDSMERQLDRSLMFVDTVSTGIVFLIFLILIFSVHRRFFQLPYEKINRAVERIEKGDFDTEIRIKQKSEMQKLAGSINKMTEKLRDNKNEIDRLHREEIDRIGELALVGELAASMAHEIKNPVSGIKNAIEIILSEQGNLKNKDIFLEMKNQTERVFKTMNDLLMFAKPKKNRIRKLSLQTLIEESIQLYERNIRRKGIHIHREYDPGADIFYGDADNLKTAFLNLILNAYQSCPGENGKIVIKTRLHSDRNIVKISIINNGLIIPGDHLDRIFEPFFTTKAKGSGLGLSTTRSIIEAHQGIIYAKNLGPYQVAFVIEVPKVRDLNSERM